jgi:hypothetical protein
VSRQCWERVPCRVLTPVMMVGTRAQAVTDQNILALRLGIPMKSYMCGCLHHIKAEKK